MYRCNEKNRTNNINLYWQTGSGYSIVPLLFHTLGLQYTVDTLHEADTRCCDTNPC